MKSSPTLEEISNYIKNKQIDLDKIDVNHGIERGLCLYVRDSVGKLAGLLIYNLLEDKSGHHIYFFGTDNTETRRELALKGLKFGCWPKSAVRKGKQVFYKHPEKLIKKLITI